MATTRAGQKICYGNWLEFTNSTTTPAIEWTTHSNNGFQGKIRFNEYLLREYDYYESYADDVGRNYYDIRLKMEGLSETKRITSNLSKDYGTTEDLCIKNSEVYCIQFKPIRNSHYTQDFSIMLRNHDTKETLVLQDYYIPAATEITEDYELFFCPESYGVSSDFDEIIFKTHRTTEGNMNVIIELEKFKMYKVANILNENFVDEAGNEIEELLGVNFETVGRGECLFFINNDTFWVGSDKNLNIAEELEVSIRRLAFIRFIPSIDAEKTKYSSNDYAICLINYKY